MPTLTQVSIGPEQVAVKKTNCTKTSSKDRELICTIRSKKPVKISPTQGEISIILSTRVAWASMLSMTRLTLIWPVNLVSARSHHLLKERNQNTMISRVILIRTHWSQVIPLRQRNKMLSTTHSLRVSRPLCPGSSLLTKEVTRDLVWSSLETLITFQQMRPQMLTLQFRRLGMTPSSKLVDIRIMRPLSQALTPIPSPKNRSKDTIQLQRRRLNPMRRSLKIWTRQSITHQTLN